MTLTTQLRASVLFLMLAALAAATVASQVVTSLLIKAVGDSKLVRVTAATSCEEGSGTHFTGCSSIL